MIDAAIIIPCNKPLIMDSQYDTCRAPCNWAGVANVIQRTKDVIVGIFSIISIVIGIFGILVRASDIRS